MTLEEYAKKHGRDADALSNALNMAIDMNKADRTGKNNKTPSKENNAPAISKELILEYLEEYKEMFKAKKYYNENDRIMIAELQIKNIFIHGSDLDTRTEDFANAMDDMIETLAEHGISARPRIIID